MFAFQNNSARRKPVPARANHPARTGYAWLLLLALFYRALIPLGYMPASPSAMPGMHASSWLMWCPAGTLPTMATVVW